MNYLLRLKLISLMICCVFFSLTACGQKNSNVVQLAPLPGSICRVAVLPMINKTEYQEGNILFYRVFVSELSRLGNFELSPEGDVRQAFRQIQVLPAVQLPSYDQLRIVGDYLNAEIMIGTTILEMKDVFSKGEVIPYITVRLDILDAKSGKKLWSVYHRRDGSQYRKVMHFGVITAMTQLAKQVSKGILDILDSKGFVGKCIE